MTQVSEILKQIETGVPFVLQNGKRLNYYKGRYYLSTFATETKLSKSKASQLIEEQLAN